MHQLRLKHASCAVSVRCPSEKDAPRFFNRLPILAHATIPVNNSLSAAGVPQRQIGLGDQLPETFSEYGQEAIKVTGISGRTWGSVGKIEEGWATAVRDENNKNDEDNEDQNSQYDNNANGNARDKSPSCQATLERSELESESCSSKELLGQEQPHQDTGNTWLRLRHHTISQDRTQASSSERDKLVALQSHLDEDSTLNKERELFSFHANGWIPAIPPPHLTRPPHLPHLSHLPRLPHLPGLEAFEAEHTLAQAMMAQRRRPRMRMQVEGTNTEGDAQPKSVESLPASNEDTNINPKNGSGELNATRITQLEEEIQNIRRLQNSLKSTSWLALHRVEGEGSSFLTEPSWTLDRQGQPKLRGHSPLANETGYLRHRSDVAFVIYKYYEHHYQAKDTEMAKAEGSVLPDPVPASQTIQLLSRQMISAVDAFIRTQETFMDTFPDWQSNKPISSPFLFWFHYRSTACLEALPEPHRSQMQLLTGWIDRNYNEIYIKANRQFHHGRISSSTMPFLVRPGEVLVSVNDEGIQGYIAKSWTKIDPSRISVQQTQEPRTQKTLQGARTKNVPDRVVPQENPQTWTVAAWSYGYDGRFYRKSTDLHIKLEFDEENRDVDIVKLGVFPLRFANGEFRNKLDRRGRIMWACRHRKLVACRDESDNDLTAEGERYMVDFKTYKQLHSDSANFKSAYPHLGARDLQEIDTEVMKSDVAPQGPHLYVFPSTIVGYNLRQKKWRDLKVDLVQDVSWNKQAFKHLVIDEETKDLVEALVTSKLETEQSTDLIQGKGNGLIVLLHGSPGTGKTFTAEGVAELAEKPLFRVTCGDIGTKPEDVEKYLESALHLGKIWGCVVLLDEADVFLEQRTLNDLERNALVSVFLRVLEYYEGILILTSNRVGTFDEAFKSRIQLSLHYDTLNKSQRRKIWENFFSLLDASETETSKIEPIEEKKRKRDDSKSIDFDDLNRHLADLAEHEMNGRQIRNAITTARQLAKFKRESMAYRHLDHVIKTSRKFDKYLEKVRDNYTDDQVARGDGIR